MINKLRWKAESDVVRSSMSAKNSIVRARWVNGTEQEFFERPNMIGQTGGKGGRRFAQGGDGLLIWGKCKRFMRAAKVAVAAIEL